MPLKSFSCSLCGAKCPKKYLAHGQFKNRIAWLRRHRKAKHPAAFKKSTKRGVAKRKAGG